MCTDLCLVSELVQLCRLDQTKGGRWQRAKWEGRKTGWHNSYPKVFVCMMCYLLIWFILVNLCRKILMLDVRAKSVVYLISCSVIISLVNSCYNKDQQTYALVLAIKRAVLASFLIPCWQWIPSEMRCWLWTAGWHKKESNRILPVVMDAFRRRCPEWWRKLQELI